MDTDKKFELAYILVEGLFRQLRNGKKFIDRNGTRLQTIYEIVNAILENRWPVEAEAK